jgi:8-oxo-dGTP pyrophosphatase MutT (NUDIX family)
VIAVLATLDGQKTMQTCTVVYALEAPPSTFDKSIFLAGPTPRDPNVPSWRPDALRALRETGYDGVVFVPEERSGTRRGDYIDQADWEKQCQNMSDCVLFWVPRDMKTMPALSTNVEFGDWMDSGRMVFGAPSWAVKNRLLQYHADRLDVPSADTIEGTVNLAIKMLGDGAKRTDGEREVPLLIWRAPSFQQWYAALKGAGNTLVGAKQVWTVRVGPKQSFLLYWALHVNIYVAAEDRHKSNEHVIGRPDISTVMLYRRTEQLDDNVVVLIREFRSHASTRDGYVRELAGGSSFKANRNPLEVAADEAREEVGIELDASRFQEHEVRQLVATMSSHKAHLFSAEITDEELDQLRAQGGVAYGVIEETELTYVEITTLGEIRRNPNVDWSMLGMILQVLV